MTKAKTAKAAADGGKKPAAAAKTAKTADAKPKTAKADKSALKAAAGKNKEAPRKPVEEKKAGSAATPSKPSAAEPPSGDRKDPPPPFSNSGLGIKTASRKPGLSVAPGAMILGRPAQARSDANRRPSERRLSKKELQEIQSFLLEKRERLLAGMRRELSMQKERAASKAADEVDKATDAYDEDLSFEIAVANDQELEEIQIALEKIEKGTYGECEICGCGISPSRLKILPSATTCVSCRGQEELARRRDEDSPTFSMMGGEEGEGETEAL